MILDGAEIILLSKKDDFGVIRYTDDSRKPIPIAYLAIGQYQGDPTIYLFKCDDQLEVQQDSVYETVAEAQAQAAAMNKFVVWEAPVTSGIDDDNFFFTGNFHKN